MKKKIFFTMALLSFILINTLKSDESYPLVELFVVNSQSTPLYIKFYPISSTFTKHCNPCICRFRLKTELNNENGEQRYRRGDPGDIPNLLYMVGLDGWALENRGTYDGYFELTQNNTLYIDHESSGSATGADGLFGYGVYNLEIYKTTNGGQNFILVTPSPIKIDCIDLNYPYSTPGNNDVTLTVYDISASPPNITFQWSSNQVTGEFSLYDSRLPDEDKGNIKYWRQYQYYENNQWVKFEVTPNFNINGISDANFFLYPIDGTEITDPNYRIPVHTNPGLVNAKLFVQSGHNPIVKHGKLYEIANNSWLKLLGGSTFTVGDNIGGNAYLKVNTGGLLWAIDGASITVKPYSELRLRKNSNVSIWNNGHIYMQPRSRFCNEGADISGSPNIHIKGYVAICEPEDQGVCIFKDSVKVLLEDTAIWEIPDSTVMQFEGSETGLICNVNSTIKFGIGSKLVFTDGARINAKHTKFTTYDSNTTWNGIYLSGLSYDTLQHCTIENALNGINIEDKTSLWQVPATEISNCEFSNKTSEQLLNMVYVNNSANVMIRNCASSSLISDGFASGVIIEYSTAGGVNLIDNEISYVTTGIDIIQSSPYIARNTITGSGSSGTGIYLDNSNGTIEYNIVDNFEKSTKLYYSSPYMLKNTFIDANTVCADVTAYSVPVMKPIASGSTLRWLGGNNYFTGQPSAAGLTLENEGHPLMDSGYNVINVGNSLYMQGTISRVLYMRVNNWYDDPPESQRFDLSGEEYDYSEYFDGYTIPPTDYYELNSIGFGYYDTVYVDEIGGDNPTAEDIFILAYRKEIERKFVEAVVLYKNVLTNY